ncbi:distal tail protein Dit [Rossellomorea vietnamensis]|uniref:distal tail protein Dit n=1 Tax=Rossellomorea vietnamensis TaxID=218284 RepID=UPI003CF718B8
MLYSFKFNSIKKPYLICEPGKRRSAFATIKRNLFYLPNMPGALHDSTDTEIRVIEQPIAINGKDRFDVRVLEEDLARWLITAGTQELVFEDEPDRTYFGMVDGSLNIEDIARFGKGVITFICIDPYKYGPLHEETYRDLATPINLNNKGSAETPPYFSMVLAQPATHLDIITEDAFMRIGRENAVTDTVYEKYTRVFSDTMNNLTGWATALWTPDGGAKGGFFKTNGNDFYADDFGSGSAWHGPAMTKSLNEVVSDYQVRATFRLDRKQNQRKRAEVYLISTSGAIIGKVSVLQRRTSGVEVEINLRNMSKNVFLYVDEWKYKEEFSGYIELSKEGTNFEFSIGQQVASGEGKTYQNHTIYKLGPEPYIDSISSFQEDLAAVGIHVGTYGNNETPKYANIREIIVNKINSEPNGIPYIGGAGDVFEFDMRNSLILKNGDIFNRKAFAASFFNLQPGNNPLVISPYINISSFYASWRDAYL